jgi:DNA replication protein DnaC
MDTDPSDSKKTSNSEMSEEDIGLARAFLLKLGRIQPGDDARAVEAAYRKHVAAAASPAADKKKPKWVDPEIVEQIRQRNIKRREKEEIDARECEANRRAVMRERFFRAAKCPARHVENENAIDPAKSPEWSAMVEGIGRAAQKDAGMLIALLGSSGTGKTQAAVSIIRRACQQELSSRYAKTADFFLDIRATYSRGCEVSEISVMKNWTGYDLLILDEAHQRSATQAEQNALTLLIDRRYDALRSTILIANQSKEEFAASVGDSIVSRIHECGKAIVCNWGSFRGSK